MLFNSYAFIFAFLPLAVAAYLVALRIAGPLAASTAALAFSAGFYLFGEHSHQWLIFVSIAFNFLVGHAILAAGPRTRKPYLILGLVANLGVLFAFKYSAFFVGQINLLLGAQIPDPGLSLPIGISFYTFTQIAFLCDCYARHANRTDPVRYGLFVTYFPHLVAGPILHHREMVPQFMRGRITNLPVRVYAGVGMFALGLAKKTLLADPCGRVASEIFASAELGPVQFVSAWVGALAYTGQIYYDFSGYSDMAIGISYMMGIRLPYNFNSPYKSRSIVEFWRRWHITLSRFLRDYLYIPLGGSRKGKARRYLNLAVTMVLGGVWHGAGWTFLVWGVIHGAALALAHSWRDLRMPRVPPFVGYALTLFLVVMAWVPFRAPTMEVAATLWAGMLGLGGFSFPALGPLSPVYEALHIVPGQISFGVPDLLLIGTALVLAAVAPNSQELMRRFRMGLQSPGYEIVGRARGFAVRMTWRWAIVFGVLFAVAARSIGGYSEFIYFQF